MSQTHGSILVVDDDQDVRAALSDLLEDHGYQVSSATNGRDGMSVARQLQPDLVLLDLGLPDIAGLDVLVDLTATTSIPVIVVSARAGEADRAIGLDLGADDYVVKPFSNVELLARIRATMRRHSPRAGQDRLTLGTMVIDAGTRDVWVDGAPVALAAREFDLLLFLARSPRHVFSRRQLLRAVWESTPDWQDDTTVAEHVYRLRRKLDPANRSRWIETVKGVGYRFTPND